jgi:hypothetical protein
VRSGARRARRSRMARKMTLNAPRQLYFVIAVVIAIVAVIAAISATPFLPISAFWVMTIAFVILALGCVIKGV